MKQLSALGARRHFFRSPRRMRALRAGMSPSELDESEMMGPGYGYFNGKLPWKFLSYSDDIINVTYVHMERNRTVIKINMTLSTYTK